LTGDEPNDIDLFALTHTRDGEWTSQESKDVYVSILLLYAGSLLFKLENVYLN
jgi:hypothetical protein